MMIMGFIYALVATVTLFCAVLLTSMLGTRLAQIHIESNHELSRFVSEHQRWIMWAMAMWAGGISSLVIIAFTVTDF